MLPPRPIGRHQVDLNEAGQNISAAQRNQIKNQVPIHDAVTGKITYVSPNDPRVKNDPSRNAESRPVF